MSNNKVTCTNAIPINVRTPLAASFMQKFQNPLGDIWSRYDSLRVKLVVIFVPLYEYQENFLGIKAAGA
jgi:hypothetical protein